MTEKYGSTCFREVYSYLHGRYSFLLFPGFPIYTVDPDQNSTLLTINDDNGGAGIGPTVGISVSETDLTEGDDFTINFDVEGEIPEDGVQILVQSSVPGALGQFDLADLNNLELSGIEELPEVGDAGGSSFFVTLTEPTASITTSVFDDIVAEEALEIPFTIANGEEYEVDPDAASITLNLADETAPAGPTVGLSVDKTDVVEGETITLTFDVDGEIPAEGVTVLVNDVASAQSQARSLTEFDVANLSTTGIEGFPTAAEGDSGFFVTITESTATITLPVFDEGADEDEANESFTFEVIDGEAYEVDPDASSITLNISDADDSTPDGIVVGISAEPTTLVEEENTQTTITFNLSEAPPEGGIEVTVDSDIIASLAEFDVGAASFDGAQLVTANQDSSGFTVNITEQVATINLPIFDDDLNEGLEEITYEIQESDSYAIDPAASSIMFSIEDNDGNGGDNTAPVGEEDSYTTMVDAPLTVSAVEGVLNNDTDPDGDELVATFVGNPDNGSVVFNEDGSFTYTPDSGFVGTDSFTYQANDGQENSEVTTVNIQVGESSELPVVSLNIEPDIVSEEDEGATVIASFSVEGEIPSEGLSILVGGDGIDLLDQVDGAQEVGFNNLAIGEFFDPETNETELILSDNEASLVFPILNDVVQEADRDFNIFLLESDGVIDSEYAIDPDATSDTVTLIDGIGGVGVGPTVGFSFTNTELAEGEEFTINFNVDGEIPSEGLTILVDSETPGVLGEFNIFDAEGNPAFEATGITGDPTVGDSSGSSFLVTLTEPDASITISTFDDGANEGLEEFSFSIVDGEIYEVDPDADEVTFSIDDGDTSFEPVFGTLEGDTIEVSGNNQLIFTGDENDLIDATTGFGDNRIYAGDGDDTLILGESDRIFGGAGDDKFFVTSSGDNTVTGGEGADQFWIATAELPGSVNIITDFTASEDVIGLAGLGIGYSDVSITDTEDGTLVANNSADLALITNVSADIIASEDNFVFV